jgi:hypothetical protein
VTVRDRILAPDDAFGRGGSERVSAGRGGVLHSQDAIPRNPLRSHKNCASLRALDPSGRRAGPEDDS